MYISLALCLVWSIHLGAWLLYTIRVKNQQTKCEEVNLYQIFRKAGSKGSKASPCHSEQKWNSEESLGVAASCEQRGQAIWVQKAALPLSR